MSNKSARGKSDSLLSGPAWETFPTFVTVVWDLPSWPIVTPGAQGSAVTSGTFYLMHPVARGHILLILWNWPQLSKPLWPHIRQLKSNPLESTLKTTQVFHMAAVFLLNRSITQAGAHFTSRLIHPVVNSEAMIHGPLLTFLCNSWHCVTCIKIQRPQVQS